MEREHGRIVTVSMRTLGSVLDGDHAAGATSLLVHDAGDFDEDGGTLSVNGATLAYASVDDDASTITLTDALPAAALDGDKVLCWDTLYNVASTEKTAMVQLDGDDDNPDPIEAWVPHFLTDKLDDGDRGGPGETVVLGYDEDDDEWQILDVRGLAGASGAGVKFCNTDTFTVTAAGDQTITLSHKPIDGSLRVAWEGVQQPASEWSLNGFTLTVPDPNGVIQINDVIDPRYAYRDTAMPAPIITLVGVTAFGHVSPQTSVALPAGVRVGDLLVLAVSANPITMNDPRMAPVYAPDPQRGIWVGVADGSGTPINVNIGDNGGFQYNSVALAAFRGAIFEADAVIPNTSVSPVTVPAIAGQKAILAWFSQEGVSGDNPNLAIPGYTEVAHVTTDTKTHAGIAYWADPAAYMSPAGSITDAGTSFSLGGAVLGVR